MSEFVIETQHLYKRFGQVTALEDINIQIRQGEFIAIMGASGSGKTTLMNILTGKTAVILIQSNTRLSPADRT